MERRNDDPHPAGRREFGGLSTFDTDFGERPRLSGRGRDLLNLSARCRLRKRALLPHLRKRAKQAADA